MLGQLILLGLSKFLGFYEAVNTDLKAFTVFRELDCASVVQTLEGLDEVFKELRRDVDEVISFLIVDEGLLGDVVVHFYHSLGQISDILERVNHTDLTLLVF